MSRSFWHQYGPTPASGPLLEQSLIPDEGDCRKRPKRKCISHTIKPPLTTTCLRLVSLLYEHPAIPKTSLRQRGKPSGMIACSRLKYPAHGDGHARSPGRPGSVASGSCSLWRPCLCRCAKLFSMLQTLLRVQYPPPSETPHLTSPNS